jgi:hypothetical protein
MKFDSRLSYRLATPRAWLIVEQGKGHDEFLFRTRRIEDTQRGST